MNIRKIETSGINNHVPLLIKNLYDYCTVLKPENQIKYREISYNYFEFKKRVQRYANLLKNLGLEGGEIIGVMDYDSHRYLESYFAVPMTGNILHTINWRLSPEQIVYTIKHAEDSVLIVNEDFLPVLEPYIDELKEIRHIIIAKDNLDLEDQPTDFVIFGEYEELLSKQADSYNFEEFDEEAVATLFYTTGTTGDPKGVYFTHRQLVLHTYNLASSLGFVSSKACRMNTDDVYLPLTPMFHVHAWGFPFLATAYSMKQVYIGKFEPAHFLETFRKEKPTFSHCVPTILNMVLNSEHAKDIDLSRWKVIIGGAAMTKNLAMSAMERGIDVIVGYGMSETCPVIGLTVLDPALDLSIEEEADWRIRTGVPPLLTNVRLVNDEGQEIKNDDSEQGEITVRAPWLTAGYYKRPEQSAELWEGGYLHTGDIATMNQHNSMKITDRIKDVIKSGGEWISSLQLEDLINHLVEVEEVAVIGVPDSRWDEKPYALIKLKKEHTLTTQHIQEHMMQYVERNLLSKWAIPHYIEFVEEIPKTSVGKIDKKISAKEC